MCNACGNYCCGLDFFGGCGCEGCDEPECWPDEDEDEFEDDIGLYGPDYDCAAIALPRARGFRCTPIAGSAAQ